MSLVFTIRLAEVNILISALHSSTGEFCREYRTEEAPDFFVCIKQEDISFEREKSAHEDWVEGCPVRQFSDAYLETLAVYRKIAGQLLDYDTLLFHGSAIAVDGAGYLFTAKSGTGKSTHTRLWRDLFGQRAVMVNDDKPLLKINKKQVTVYGTPWDGKHRLSTNTSVPLRGLCILERSDMNHIEEISRRDALPMLLQQSFHPAEPEAMEKVLTLVDTLASTVKLYRLECTMEKQAAQTAFEGMQ